MCANAAASALDSGFRSILALGRRVTLGRRATSGATSNRQRNCSNAKEFERQQVGRTQGPIDRVS